MAYKRLTSEELQAFEQQFRCTTETGGCKIFVPDSKKSIHVLDLDILIEVTNCGTITFIDNDGCLHTIKPPFEYISKNGLSLYATIVNKGGEDAIKS